MVWMCAINVRGTWKLQVLSVLYWMISLLLLRDQIGIQLASLYHIANIRMLILLLPELLQTDLNYRNAAVDIKEKELSNYKENLTDSRVKFHNSFNFTFLNQKIVKLGIESRVFELH